ncbi:DUF4113 domain-containing protein [Leptolyngbya sp. CCNP1308]|uniref:DUF4113 domain-containing protein n=1 Tax=Leptolyngbya sp. CCNP1308 TaxID=3110255 RepID=UPI002B1F099A|nr:DUF4113 domain-containing protein [Leptolyngbya sp. CCNP1308]MEA5447626.1 DUF4113 domain-containing protein [Leptolyngbya sp. CCNP1308]
MAATDSRNCKLSPDAVKFGAMGLKPTWAMRSDYFSQRYTTYWGEIPTVKVWQGSSIKLSRKMELRT